MSTTLRLQNDINELARVVEALESFAGEEGLSAEVVQDLNLVLEELITNVIWYGAPEGQPAESLWIEVGLSRDDGQVTVRLVDNGRPFDPLQAAPPDLDGSIEERGVGGLGIHFVRQLMQDLKYTRDGDCNVLVMTKSV